ncbi:hemolysin III family protein, partial [bacterium]
MLAKFRQPASGLTHLAGAALALIGLVVLLVRSGNQLVDKIALLVYGASLFGLFLASGLYHSVCSSTRGIDLLRK